MVANFTEVEKKLTDFIQARTFQRINLLDVKLDSDRLVVSGNTSIYFVKQLAVHSVFEAMERMGLSRPVEFRVEVVDSHC